jgi:hypothetical protein
MRKEDIHALHLPSVFLRSVARPTKARQANIGSRFKAMRGSLMRPAAFFKLYH